MSKRVWDRITPEYLESINFPYYYNLVKEGKMKRTEVMYKLWGCKECNNGKYYRCVRVLEGKDATRPNLRENQKKRSEAIKNGTWKFTDIDKNLRIFDSEGNITHIRCKTCKEMKPVSEYHKCSSKIGGYQDCCKKCKKAWNTSEHGKELLKERNHRRKAIKKGSFGDYTEKEWNECLEFFNYKDAYTGLDMRTVSRDHVIPISKGGTNCINNLVPCEFTVNCSKNNNDLLEWYIKQEYFDLGRYNKILLWLERGETA